MSLLVPWIGTPLLLALLCLGCALALERISGAHVSGPLLLPLGLAVVIVLAQALTASGATAKLATPAVVGLSVAGLALVRRDRRRGIGPALIGAGVVYLIYGLPVLASGAATFTGFIKLDDTASWLGIVDQVMSHGRDLHGLAASNYQAALAAYLPNGYPLGGFLGLGVAHQVLGSDAMWMFQPFEAYCAGMLALVLYALTDGVVTRTAPRVLVAAVAAQSATLFAYSLWGGIKEMVAAAMLPLVAALAGESRPEKAGGRAFLPLAVGASAVLATLSVGAIVWTLPLVAPALLVGAKATRRAPWRALVPRDAGWLALLVTICSIPALLSAKVFLAPLFAHGAGAGGVFTSQVQVGNLLHPLSALQVVGIWPVGDFRINPTHLTVTRLLIVLAVTLGAVGLVLAWRRESRALPAYVIGVVVVCLATASQGSPWVNGKSLAEASPAVLLAALSAAAIAWDRRDIRVLGLVGGVVLAAGVLWSNALAYREVNLAPRAQLLELVQIAGLAGGNGPTLMTQYSLIGPRHILRAADVETNPGLPGRPLRLRDGSVPRNGYYDDLDDYARGVVWSFRSLVVRRSPLASRPPAAYSLRWAGRYYELWQRPTNARAPTEHLALGDATAPGAVPACSDVMRLAREAGPGGHLATVVRSAPQPLPLDGGPLPPGWRPSPTIGHAIPGISGTLERDVTLGSGGRLEVWLGGSSRGLTTLLLDGRVVGSERQQLNWPGAFTQFGVVDVAPGLHRLTVHYDDGGLEPGNLGEEINPFSFGPVEFATQTAELPVENIPSSRARTLCGQTLDWIEALPAS